MKLVVELDGLQLKKKKNLEFLVFMPSNYCVYAYYKECSNYVHLFAFNVQNSNSHFVVVVAVFMLKQQNILIKVKN